MCVSVTVHVIVGGFSRGSQKFVNAHLGFGRDSHESPRALAVHFLKDGLTEGHSQINYTFVSSLPILFRLIITEFDQV